MSYTQDECIGSVSQKILDESVAADDINGCMKLSKLPSAYQDKFTECKEKIATVEKMTTKDTNIDDVIAQLKSDPNNPELKKQLDDLKTQKQAMFEMMWGTQQGQYLQKKREEIMEGIEDEDVKSAIAKEFTPYRQNETNINNMLDKLQEVTEKQKRIKSADEKANELVDKLKEQLDGIVQEKQDEIVGAMWDKAVEWIQENGGKDLNYALNDMKWAMEKYEKGSKMYEDAKAKYDKIKKVYDEVMGVYNRVDEVNKLLAQGKIDKGKAEVLKWAILLDKWLEYATGYVPVFGSTISTISKETFGTVIEFAKKRAQRTTSIDKCIEDPENCDPNGISAY